METLRARPDDTDGEDAEHGGLEFALEILGAATDDGLLVCDESGRIVAENGRLAEIFGYAPGELVGRSVEDLLPERLAAGHRDERVGYSAHPTPRTMRARPALVGRRRDGTELPVDVSLGPLAGGQRHTLAVVRDATERVQVQEQLRVADRMASLGFLAASIAHEINNPIFAVMTALDVALRGLEARTELGVSEAVDRLRDAREAAGRVGSIVRDVRMFAQPGDDRTEEVDVRGVVESSLRLARHETRHRARVVSTFGDVPRVVAPQARLGQVVLNLVVNAAQAFPDGDVQNNEIRITTAWVDRRVAIEVADNGPGITQDILEKLFTAFVTTKPVGVGTGLGLSVCRRIVMSLGGEITVESRPGEGTTFRVLLPAAGQ